MVALIRNSSGRIGVVKGNVVGYRVIESTESLTMTVLLTGVVPEVTFETAPDEATMIPLVASFIQSVEA